jgi:hypothetical protein
MSWGLSKCLFIFVNFNKSGAFRDVRSAEKNQFCLGVQFLGKLMAFIQSRVCLLYKNTTNMTKMHFGL